MRTRTKKIMSLMLAAAMTAGTMTGMTVMPAKAAEDPTVQAQFYVDVNGNDDNDGSKEKPFATVERARAEVDKINDDMTGDIIVNIGEGDYYLEDTLTFDESDSGTNEHEVIYRSADGNGKANLIGGEKITGWELADETDVEKYDLDAALVGKVYKKQLDPEKYDFNTMYVNDERAVMARTRNRDNHPNFPMARGEYLRSTGGRNADHNMFFNLSDLDEKSIEGMKNAQARGEKEIAQVYVWDGGSWDWFTNTIPVESISGNQLKFPVDPENQMAYTTRYDIQSGARFFLQGNLAFMDVEGEYHYNKSTGILYYYPKKEDGAIAEQNIVVPTMQKALYFKGAEKANLADKPDPDKQVHDITIDGLAIKDTEFDDYYTYSMNPQDQSLKYPFPKEALASTNPTYCTTADRPEFRVASITLDGTHDITIKNTRVKNAGMYGIVYAGDNQNNILKDSVIENAGYGGVMYDGGYPGVGKYNNHNSIDNVLVHDVGEQVGHAIGLTLMSSGQNEINNMEIFNTPKRAILVIGGYAFYNGIDKDYEPLRDMYTVGNHFKYIHVHDAQQDAGEDSAVFLSWLLAGKDIQRMHGSNDPNKVTENLDGIDMSIDRYNYFDQMLITDVGADPSVIEKCTVGGLDTAMGASGTQFKNIQAANTQHHLLAIRPGSYGDVYNYENCTNNVQDVTHSDELKTFDNSKMEYDKIGLKPDFPSEYKVEKREYDKAPEDLYFGDDFEASRELDTTKWNVEKGNMEMHHGYGAMSENPKEGRRSLPIDADLNPGGIVVSREFEHDLNKIVEVKYLDRRKDYAGNDAVDSGRTGILPNSFLRVDDGEHALGLGAVGRKSKDYYMIKKGDELIQTNVKRYFGWHTFKFDYSSGTDVKLYIDDQLVATYGETDGVATSFNYIAMGDWEGLGGKAFFDQLYVYGGQDAPAVKPLPAIYKIPGVLEAENYQDMSGITVEDCADTDGGQNITDIDTADWMRYNVRIDDTGVYDVNYRVMVPEGKNAEFDVWVDDEVVKTVNLASTNGEWKNVSERVSLVSGLHKIKLEAKSAGWKLNKAEFKYLAPEVPGKIIAEKYTDMQGIQIADCAEGGNCVGYINDGDWFEYDIWVNEPGRYQVDYRVAVNNDANGTVQFVANNEVLTTTTLPNTGDWQKWVTVSDEVEFAEAGLYKIRMQVVVGNWNLSWFELTKMKEEENPLTPEEVLADVVIESPAFKQAKLELPKVSGFKFEVVESTDSIIGKDGTIKSVLKDTKVTLKLKATKIADQTSAVKEFEITVLGVGKSLDTPIEANAIDGLKGTHIKVQDNEVWNFNGGDWIRYDFVDFGEKEKDIRFHIDTAIHPDYDGKKIHVMLDDPTNGTNVGTVVVEGLGWGVYQTQTIELTQKVSGVHSVYLVGEGGEGVAGVKAVMFEEIKKADEKDTFTITVDGISTEYAYNAPVTVEASETKEGVRFAYWMADGEIVSYKPVYKFYASKDMELTAVYENEVQEKAKAMLTNVFATKRDDGKTDVKFVGELIIPEGYSIVNAGLIWSSKSDTVLITEDDKFGEGLRPTYISKISDTNQFSVTIKGMPTGKYIRGKIFATITNGTETKVISSEEKKVDAK